MPSHTTQRTWSQRWEIFWISTRMNTFLTTSPTAKKTLWGTSSWSSHRPFLSASLNPTATLSCLNKLFLSSRKTKMERSWTSNWPWSLTSCKKRDTWLRQLWASRSALGQPLISGLSCTKSRNLTRFRISWKKNCRRWLNLTNYKLLRRQCKSFTIQASNLHRSASWQRPITFWRRWMRDMWSLPQTLSISSPFKNDLLLISRVPSKSSASIRPVIPRVLPWSKVQRREEFQSWSLQTKAAMKTVHRRKTTLSPDLLSNSVKATANLQKKSRFKLWKNTCSHWTRKRESNFFPSSDGNTVSKMKRM